MLGWAIFFLIVALLAAVLGFGGVAAAADIGVILFIVFIALFILTLIVYLVRGRSRPIP